MKTLTRVICLSAFLLLFASAIFSQNSGFILLPDSTILTGKFEFSEDLSSIEFKPPIGDTLIRLSPENVLYVRVRNKFTLHSKSLNPGEKPVFLREIKKKDYALLTDLSKQKYFIESPSGQFFTFSDDKEKNKEVFEELWEERPPVFLKKSIFDASEKDLLYVLQYLNSKHQSVLPFKSFWISVSYSNAGQLEFNRIDPKLEGNFAKNTNYNIEIGKLELMVEVPLNKKGYFYLLPSIGLSALLFDDLKTNGLTTSDIDANALYAFGSLGFKARLNTSRILPYLDVGFSAHQQLYNDEISAVYKYQDSHFEVEILNTDLTGSFLYGPYGVVGMDFPAFNRLMGVELKYDHLFTSESEYSYFVRSFSLGIKILF